MSPIRPTSCAHVVLWLAALVSCRRQEEPAARQDVWDAGSIDSALPDANDAEAEAEADAAADAGCGAASAAVAPWTAMLKVTVGDHGVDGVVETFFAKASGNVAVRLRPTGGSESVVMLGEAYQYPGGPVVRSMRFGDAGTASLLVRLYRPVGWNFIATVYAVVDIEKGKLVRARAQHTRSTAMRDVEVWDLGTGVGQLDAAEVRPGRECGHELVQVSCSSWFPDVKKKPVTPCDSRNDLFFFDDSKWWWDQLTGKSCVPKDSGYCYPPSPLPSAKDFPPTVAPTSTPTE